MYVDYAEKQLKINSIVFVCSAYDDLKNIYYIDL